MKSIIILSNFFLAGLALNVTANDTSVQAYMTSASYLEQQNYPQVARNILKTGYQASQQLAILYHWLSLDEKRFQNLKERHKKNYLTLWKTQFEAKCLAEWHYGWTCSEQDRQRELSYQEMHQVSIKNIKEVRKILYEYDELKKSLLEIQNLINDQLLKSSEAQIIKIQKFFQKHQILIEEIKKNRSDYLSFDIISPYLARAEQLLLIAKISNPEISSIITFLPTHSLEKLISTEELHEALIHLALMTEQNILLDSHELVRQQFVNVYEKLKEIEKKSEFEEFEIIQNLAEQLTREQQLQNELGIDRWWK